MDNFAIKSSVAKDMKWSSTLFINQVWPIAKKYIGGELMQMEGRPDMELATMLDMKAGIDGWNIHTNGLRGIASRIQAGADWRTFTIRESRDSGAETEFEKRKRAIESNEWLYPAITIQAYAQTQTGPILSIGITHTTTIIKYIKDGCSYIRPTCNARFYVCEWDKMSKNNYKVLVIDLTKKL